MCVPKTSAKSINFKGQSLNRRRAQALASHKIQRRRQLGKMKSKLADKNINLPVPTVIRIKIAQHRFVHDFSISYNTFV